LILDLVSQRDQQIRVGVLSVMKKIRHIKRPITKTAPTKKIRKTLTLLLMASGEKKTLKLSKGRRYDGLWR
jgi:hypothetical protein